MGERQVNACVFLQHDSGVNQMSMSLQKKKKIEVSEAVALKN